MQIFVLEQSKLFLTRTYKIVFEQANEFMQKSSCPILDFVKNLIFMRYLMQ